MLFILLYANEEIICGISAEGFLLLFVDEEVFLNETPNFIHGDGYALLTAI